MEITDSSWSALNTTYDIMEQLEIQTNGTVIIEADKRRLN